MDISRTATDKTLYGRLSKIGGIMLFPSALLFFLSLFGVVWGLLDLLGNERGFREFLYFSHRLLALVSAAFLMRSAYGFKSAKNRTNGVAKALGNFYWGLLLGLLALGFAFFRSYYSF